MCLITGFRSLTIIRKGNILLLIFIHHVKFFKNDANTCTSLTSIGLTFPTSLFPHLSLSPLFQNGFSQPVRKAPPPVAPKPRDPPKPRWDDRDPPKPKWDDRDPPTPKWDDRDPPKPRWDDRDPPKPPSRPPTEEEKEEVEKLKAAKQARKEALRVARLSTGSTSSRSSAGTPSPLMSPEILSPVKSAKVPFCNWWIVGVFSFPCGRFYLFSKVGVDAV